MPAMELARMLERAVQRGDVAGVEGLFDSDAFLNRTMSGLSSTPQFDQGFRQEFRKRASMLKSLVNEGHAARFRLLRIRRIDGESRAFYRLLTKEIGGGCNYQAWVLGKDPQGHPKFVDVYVASGGELMSQTVRRGYLMGAVQANPGLLQRLAGAEKAYADNFQAVARFGDLAYSGRFQDALDAYRSLPSALQRNKTVMLMRLNAALRLHKQAPQEYDQTLAEFQQFFPGDPCLDLLCLTPQSNGGRYDEALRSLDRLDVFTGGDAYLDYLRAELYFKKGTPADLANAKRICRAAIAREPGLAEPYWELLAFSLRDRDFDQAAALLDEMRQALGLQFTSLDKSPRFAAFVKSDAYRKWKASHPQ